MGLAEELELQRLLRAHDLLDAEDDGEVRDKGGEDDLVGGKRCFALDIVCPSVGHGGEGCVGKEEVGEGSHGE